MSLHTIICSLKEVQNISHLNGEFIRLLRWIWLNTLHLWWVWNIKESWSLYLHICILWTVLSHSVLWDSASPVWWALVDIKRVRRFGVRAHIHRSLSLLSKGCHWLVTKGKFNVVWYVRHSSTRANYLDQQVVYKTIHEQRYILPVFCQQTHEKTKHNYSCCTIGTVHFKEEEMI